MKARVELFTIIIAFVVVGCGSNSNVGKRDAGPWPDAVVAPDGLASGDTLAHDDLRASGEVLPDLIQLLDGAPDGQSTLQDLPPREVEGDAFAGRDLALADVVADRPVEVGSRDLLTSDSVAGSDLAAREVAAEPPVPDAAVTDVAADIPREAAREVLPFLVDGPLASFCSGDSARMVVNGIESHPAVTGNFILLSCCMASAFSVTTATFAEPIVVEWQDYAGNHTNSTMTCDLANPPSGFTVRVVAGCDPQDATCGTPGEVFESGFQGTLALARLHDAEISLGFDMSLCLHLKEPAGSPHRILHSLDLYAPHVLAASH